MVAQLSAFHFNAVQRAVDADTGRMQEEGYWGERPSIVRALVGLRRYFLAEWLSTDPEADARRRAGWPLWRRAVRPIGAIARWAGALPSLIAGHRVRIDSYGGLLVAANVVLVCCVAIWAVDKIREHRRRHATETTQPGG